MTRKISSVLVTGGAGFSGKAQTIVHVPPRGGEIRRSVADISKAQTQLHFSPKTDLENDLRELWNYQSK